LNNKSMSATICNIKNYIIEEWSNLSTTWCKKIVLWVRVLGVKFIRWKLMKFKKFDVRLNETFCYYKQL
jgi:hypothetical protein